MNRKWVRNYFIYIIILSVLTSCTSFRFSKKIQRKDNHWLTQQTSNYTLFYKENSLFSKDTLGIYKIESSISLAKQKSKLDSFKQIPFHLYIVNSPEEINQFVKKGLFNGLTYTRSNTIIQTYKMVGNPHEIFHLLTIGNWGETEKWIKEGSAVYSEGKYRTLPLHNYAHFIIKNNKVAQLTDIFKEKSFYTIPSKYSYSLAGSMIQYIIDTYGYDAFKQIWKDKNLRSQYTSNEKFLEEWREYVSDFPTDMIIEK